MKSIWNFTFLAHAISLKEMQKSHFVFDLDSTIFNVTPRSQAIFEAFQKAHPKELTPINFKDNEWGLRDAFARQNIHTSDPIFKEFLYFWREEFFSSRFLHIDKPYAGALEFIQYISEHGGSISYLTGRDWEHMHRGTVESLIEHKLPLDKDFKNLYMKPEKAWGQDQDFKSRMLTHMTDTLDGEIYFFENEPSILNMAKVLNPNVELIYMNTVHSGTEEIMADIYHLKGWVPELEEFHKKNDN